MRIFKKKRRINDATSFKVIYPFNGEYFEKEFAKRKSLDQWVARRCEDSFFLVMQYQALIDGEWEAFTTIGKKSLLLNELNNIVVELSEVYKTSK